MLPKLFENHGRFCAGHPLEVIVTTFTLTACMLNLETGNAQSRENELPISTSTCWRDRCNSEDPSAADVILMTIIRCIAILFSYHRFRNLHNLGSKYIIGIAGLFTIFSGLVFTSGVVNFGRSNMSDLKDAFFFFLLLIDVNKAGILAQLALSSKNQEEVRANIARGMSLLGPSITLDTLVSVLLIGIGSLSGVKRLEVLCGFACLGVLVNYAVFMTFYPACLSLILELSRGHQVGSLSADKILMIHSLDGEDQKPNPVVERLKMIMIGGLFIVHAHSRWPFRQEVEEEVREEVNLVTTSPSIQTFEPNHQNKTEDPLDFRNYLMNWLSVSADNIVIVILLVALAVKVIFFEDKGEIAKQLRFKEGRQEVVFTKEDDETSENMESPVPPVATSLRQRTMPTTAEVPKAVFPRSGMGIDWLDDNQDDTRVDKEVQTEDKADHPNDSNNAPIKRVNENENLTVRSIEECKEIYNSELGAHALTDKEVIQLVNHKVIQCYQLEKAVGDMERGVGLRRQVVGAAGKFAEKMEELPYTNYDYSKVLGSCCENVIGYVPVPLGIAGPLKVDGELVHVPMATTEGCLIASTNRGSRALLESGVTSRVVADGMTRGPVVRFPDIVHASEAMAWMQDPEHYEQMKESFDTTSRFARLCKIHVRIAGRYLFIRFVATTGDAMGMNMLSKGTQESLKLVKEHFPDMEILSLSGNFCTDKKPAAVNWIEGRGKSVVCEAIVPAHIVSSVLKTSVHALVDVNIAKNMIGSAVAGSIGGFNAHAANIVTAIYIATGQDPAQNVGSSNCMTLMEPWGPEGDDLYVSCTMPSIEIGTIGGGTGLPAQSACLDILGVKGTHVDGPGMNASKLARIVCATVLAGELSLMAALTAGDLVKSHLRHNRSSTTVSNVTSTPYYEVGRNLTVPTVVHDTQPMCADSNRAS